MPSRTRGQQRAAGQDVLGKVFHDGDMLHAPAVGVLELLNVVQAAARRVAHREHGDFHHAHGVVHLGLALLHAVDRGLLGVFDHDLALVKIDLKAVGADGVVGAGDEAAGRAVFIGRDRW